MNFLSDPEEQEEIHSRRNKKRGPTYIYTETRKSKNSPEPEFQMAEIQAQIKVHLTLPPNQYVDMEYLPELVELMAMLLTHYRRILYWWI